MVPSLGFDVPIVGLVLGLLVLVVSLFLGGGLNLAVYVGIAIGFASVIALLLAVISTPTRSHDSSR